MDFPKGGRVLELGCGTGEFWHKNSLDIPQNLNITLSDFSSGMLKSTKETLKDVKHVFSYKEVNAENIPYEDGTFDVVIARHMVYLIPNIEKALKEIKRVLKKGGVFYATCNSVETMKELNILLEKFDDSLELHNGGMSDRFTLENGESFLKNYFIDIKKEVLEGKIVVDHEDPIVSYKASTIKGSKVLIGKKKKEFSKYLKEIIEKEKVISITTKSGIFKSKKF